MIIFWIIVVVMIVITLFVILRPLKNKFISDAVISDKSNQQQQNINITKERLSDLKAELEQGIIDQQSYEQSRTELEFALLGDVDNSTETSKSHLVNERYQRYTLRGLLVLIPAFTLSLYFILGQSNIIGNVQQQASMPEGHGSSDSKLPSIDVMIEKLSARLQKEPNNAEGWYMLGRSYMSLGQYENAVSAFEKTNQLMPNNPTIMLRYADALTMIVGGKIQGKPFELIQKALKLSPNDTTGLWLAGMGYEEQGEYNKAISYWNRLLPLLQDEKSITEVKTLISAAQQKAGIEVVDNSAAKTPIVVDKNIASLKVSVTLDSALTGNVNKNDTVFIFAKAVNGPPMPLAVVRKQVKDLPLQVTLDDSMAMMPTMKLSSFQKVLLIARVSKSGQPVAQPGDYTSTEQIINLPFTQIINIKINTITK